MKPDDISPGQWVAVIGCPAAPEAIIDFGGRPVRVVTVSLPFLAVNDGDKIITIDTRFWEVGRVSEEYVQAVLGMNEPEAPDESACPRCAYRLCQKSVCGEWKMWCRECRYEGTVSA